MRAKVAAEAIGTAVLFSGVAMGVSILFSFANQLTLGSADNALVWELLATIFKVPPTALIGAAAAIVFVVLAGGGAAVAICGIWDLPRGAKASTLVDFGPAISLGLIGAVVGLVVTGFAIVEMAPDVLAWARSHDLAGLVLSVLAGLAVGLFVGPLALVGRAVSQLAVRQRAPVAA